jgi:hypothetical protein
MSSESISPLRPVAGNIELPAMVGPAGVGRQDQKKKQEQKKRRKEQPPKESEPALEEPQGQPDDESEPGPTVDCYG